MPSLSNTRLVGGTALALQLGHRKSIDLDLFGTFDPMVSYRKILLDSGYSADGSENGAVQSLRVDGAKVDLVNYPYPWLDEPSFPLRGLMYFDDAEDDPMPEMLGGGLAWNAVKAKVVSATREVILIT